MLDEGQGFPVNLHAGSRHVHSTVASLDHSQHRLDVLQADLPST